MPDQPDRSTDLHRPEPVDPAGARPVDRTTPVPDALAAVQRGERLLITDRYATGAEILDRLAGLFPDEGDYADRSEAKRAHREAALRVLAPIADGKLALSGARPIGFLAELYPELDRFVLPLVEVQELHDAWKRYRTGVHLAVLGGRVHPWFGTYVPRRTEHLELFATWLSAWEGGRDRAIDVGTGCGVLARMLRRAGFASVRATDRNPNAIHSVQLDLQRAEVDGIDLVCADLLGPEPGHPDLVVCNPPWLPGPPTDAFEAALHYGPELFPRLFDQAAKAVQGDARLVILFSTIGTLMRPDLPHPIEAELALGRFVEVQRLRRKVKGSRRADGSRRRTKERVEVWELRRA